MSKPLRILIVEDELEWAKRIKSNLLEILHDLRLPCSIDAPESIQECKAAIRSAVEKPYDLITLDINYRNDSANEPTDGLKLLGIIGQYQSAWLVSILTGIAVDETVAATYGEERARQLQEELRSRAYTSFPPERLLVLEKPALDDAGKLAKHLRQICLILRQSLVGRNLFRPLELPCQVACHRTMNGDLIKRDSKEFRRAWEAMEFVKKYESDPTSSQDPARKKQYEREIKLDILKKVGGSKKLTNAEWVDDQVSLRQVRFGCGEVITLRDTPNFETIAWLLRHPGKPFKPHEIGGEAAELGRLSAEFQHSGDADAKGGETEQFDPEDDDFDMSRDRQGKDRDFESGATMGDAGSDWDTTEAESRAAYKSALRKKEAELEIATGHQRNILESEIEHLKIAIGEVRKKAVAGKTHGLIKQHKSRTIAALKEAGQVELANHLEKTIRNKGSEFWYDVEPGSIFWNVD